MLSFYVIISIGSTTFSLWCNFSLDTVAGDDKIRVVPSIRDKKGLAWTKTPFESKQWEIEVHVRIEGKGRLGADGLVSMNMLSLLVTLIY